MFTTSQHSESPAIHAQQPGQHQPQHKHVIERFLDARQAGTGPKTMIIGHRGGYVNGPENSMKCFNAAIEANLEGIEFDVSCNYS